MNKLRCFRKSLAAGVGAALIGAAVLGAAVLFAPGCRCQCSNDHQASDKPIFLPGTPMQDIIEFIGANVRSRV